MAVLAFWFLLSNLRAEFQVPPLSGPVVDQADILSASARDSLDRFLRGLRERGGAQIQVATVHDLGGSSIEEVSIRITDQWKLGNKKEDRGVLLLIAAAEHRVRIEVGRGLEGDLPDVTANRIIRDVIVPRFKEGSVDRAVLDGVLAIVHYTDPQLLSEDGGEMPVRGHSSRHSGLIKFLTLLFWLMVFIIAMSSRGGRGVLAGFLLGGGFGGRGGGGGGGWGGSGSGGGWSGGGGGFSGGGSSGSW